MPRLRDLRPLARVDLPVGVKAPRPAVARVAVRPRVAVAVSVVPAAVVALLACQ